MAWKHKQHGPKENKSWSLHMCYLCCILKWSNKAPNSKVVACTHTHTLASSLCTCCSNNVGCAGLAMCTGWKMAITQKDILYGELVYLQLYYKDVCKHMTVLNINTESWEDAVSGAVCSEITQVGRREQPDLN